VINIILFPIRVVVGAIFVVAAGRYIRKHYRQGVH